MERKLLLLGLLRVQEMHGYQLSEVIDTHLGSSLQLKRATAYDLLDRMAADGWITAYRDQVGKRPARRVYAITAQGEAAFQVMLRESLARYQPAEFLSDLSVAFVDQLPPDEAIELLAQRRSAIAALLDESEGLASHPGAMQWVVEHQRRHLAAELEWVNDLMTRLSTHAKDSHDEQ